LTPSGGSRRTARRRRISRRRRPNGELRAGRSRLGPQLSTPSCTGCGLGGQRGL
jgi:hypothetical protein